MRKVIADGVWWMAILTQYKLRCFSAPLNSFKNFTSWFLLFRHLWKKEFWERPTLLARIAWQHFTSPPIAHLNDTDMISMRKKSSANHEAYIEDVSSLTTRSSFHAGCTWRVECINWSSKHSLNQYSSTIACQSLSQRSHSNKVWPKRENFVVSKTEVKLLDILHHQGENFWVK